MADDCEALHSWIEMDGKIVAVGRAHLIPSDSDGSQADHAGPDAVKCPAFGPLSKAKNRPAIQIRQMGTLPSYQRKGLAAKVLAELEAKSIEKFEAIIGLLQAREHAIPFYKSQGWEIIDDPYEIGIIGPHRSMMKYLQ